MACASERMEKPIGHEDENERWSKTYPCVFSNVGQPRGIRRHWQVLFSVDRRTESGHARDATTVRVRGQGRSRWNNLHALALGDQGLSALDLLLLLLIFDLQVQGGI